MLGGRTPFLSPCEEKVEKLFGTLDMSLGARESPAPCIVVRLEVWDFDLPGGLMATSWSGHALILLPESKCVQTVAGHIGW